MDRNRYRHLSVDVREYADDEVIWKATWTRRVSDAAIQFVSEYNLVDDELCLATHLCYKVSGFFKDNDPASNYLHFFDVKFEGESKVNYDYFVPSGSANDQSSSTFAYFGNCGY